MLVKSKTRKRVLLVLPMIDDAGVALLAESHSVAVIDSAEEDAIRSAIPGVHAAIVRSPARLSAACLDAGTDLEIVSASGAGMDTVDVARATELGIPVLYAPGVGAPSVVEFTVGALVMAGRNIGRLHASCHEQDLDWSRRIGDLAGFELRDRTLGVVGLGHIGREVARRAHAAYDLEVVGFDPYVDATDVEGVEVVETLDDLLERAHIVSVHVALNDETRGMFGRAQLARMRPGSFIVNTSRGHVINDEALAQALRSGHIAGAVIDCFAAEPTPAASPLADAPNVILTPHVAGLTDRSMSDLAKAVAAGVVTALRGERPPYVANPHVWDQRRALQETASKRGV